MSHKNSNSSKLNEEWFLELSKNSKFFYYYLNDKVDIAGFYRVSFPHIELEIKMTEMEAKESLDELAEKNIIIWSDDRKSIWVTNFLQGQNNYPIKPANNCHKGILAVIRIKLKEFSKSVDVFKKLMVEYTKTDSDKGEVTIVKVSLLDYLK
jgi:hypothetical protein